MTLSLLCLIFLSYQLVTIQAAEFEPYCLNGGLVTAVAGTFFNPDIQHLKR